MLGRVKPDPAPPLASPQLSAFLDDFRAAVKALRPEQEQFHKLEWENFALRGRCADLESENRAQLQDLFELRMATLQQETVQKENETTRLSRRGSSTAKFSLPTTAAGAKIAARTTFVEESAHRSEALKSLQQKRVDGLCAELAAAQRSAGEERVRHEAEEKALIARVQDLELRLEKAFAGFFEARKVLAAAQEEAAGEALEARAAVELLLERLAAAEQKPRAQFAAAALNRPRSAETVAEVIARQYGALQRQWTAILAAERAKSQQLEKRLKELAAEKKLRIEGFELELARLRQELREAGNSDPPASL